MVPAPFRVVLDACVLFPLNVRDMLLRAAEKYLYQPRWTAEILEEVRRNLVKKTQANDSQAKRVVVAMSSAFEDALVEDYEGLVASMHNDPKDRHVAAAAVRAGAQVIVTYNLSDFRELPDGIEAQHPDEFLSNLFDLDSAAMVDVVEEAAADRTRPPITVDALLTALSRSVPEFAAAVATFRAERSRDE